MGPFWGSRSLARLAAPIWQPQAPFCNTTRPGPRRRRRAPGGLSPYPATGKKKKGLITPKALHYRRYLATGPGSGAAAWLHLLPLSGNRSPKEVTISGIWQLPSCGGRGGPPSNQQCFLVNSPEAPESPTWQRSCWVLEIRYPPQSLESLKLPGKPRESRGLWAPHPQYSCRVPEMAFYHDFWVDG